MSRPRRAVPGAHGRSADQERTGSPDGLCDRLKSSANTSIDSAPNTSNRMHRKHDIGQHGPRSLLGSPRGPGAQAAARGQPAARVRARQPGRVGRAAVGVRGLAPNPGPGRPRAAFGSGMNPLRRAVPIAAALTAVVAVGSGTLSWDALRWGAGQLGVDDHLTWIYPIVLDGMIGVGTVAALALRGARRRIRAYVWALLGGAIGASVVGNAAHAAGGSPVHVAGSAVPAVALAASLHLLVILVREASAKVP